MGAVTKKIFKNDQSMAGTSLPKTRYPLTTHDHERGKVGWAHWRSMKKKSTSRLRRRVHDKAVIAEELDQEIE